MSGAVGRRPSVVSRQYPDEIRDGGSQSCGNTSRHASVRSESLASDILFVALSLDNSKYVQDQSCWAPPRRQLVPLIVAGVYGDVVILTARTGMAWSTTARGRGLGQQHHLGSVSQTPTFVYAFMLSTSQDKARPQCAITDGSDAVRIMFPQSNDRIFSSSRGTWTAVERGIGDENRAPPPQSRTRSGGSRAVRARRQLSTSSGYGFLARHGRKPGTAKN